MLPHLHRVGFLQVQDVDPKHQQGVVIAFVHQDSNFFYSMFMLPQERQDLAFQTTHLDHAFLNGLKGIFPVHVEP